MAKLEEMERLLREAQAEKRSLLEHKVPPKIQLKKKKIQLYMLILAVHRGIVFSCNWPKAAALTQLWPSRRQEAKLQL